MAGPDEAPSGGDYGGGGENLPRPDPTRLTTQLVDRALSAFREVVEARLEAIGESFTQTDNHINRIAAEAIGDREELRAEVTREIQSLRELLEARLAGMDRAAELLATEMSTQPTAIAAAREQVMAEVSNNLTAVRELLETRFRGMDEATKLLASNVDKVPYAILQEAGNLKALLQREILNVQDVAAEKFAAIEGTFASNALALTAALAAQKEAAAEQNKSNTLAISKSEQATKETILANAAQTASGLTAQASNLQDVKERVVRIESMGVGSATQRSEHRLDIGAVIAAIAVVVAVISVIVVTLKH